MTDRPDPVVAELRRRWAEGDRVRVERLLASHPGLTRDPDRVLDLIYAEVLLRERVGEHPAADEYARRFPALAAAIRTQFEVHEAIDAEPELPDVPGYDVLRELGRGGAGAVYEADDRATGRRVAVKLIRPDLFDSHTARKRFEIEARVGTLLGHPGIVPVYHVGESAAGPFLVMERMAGSLEAVVRGGPLAPAAAALLVPVAEAVHFAHGQGVVHRDLKPANVLLAGVGIRDSGFGDEQKAPPGSAPNPESRIPTPAPKVSDFGLAKLVARSLSLGVSSTQQGVILGTPAYMPPEQAAGTAQPGPAQDVYALGGILFALLTGRQPFDEGSPLATLLRVRAGRPPSVRAANPDVPAALDAICTRCLSPDPADRYPSAAALAAALRAAMPAADVEVVLVPAAGGEPVRVRVTPAGVVVGRSSECGVVLPVRGVSRRHCRLTATPGGVVVEDLESSRGTTVNGAPARGPTRFGHGDLLGIAHLTFRVEVRA